MKTYNSWWSAAWRRALKTVVQTLAASASVGLVISPEMLRDGGVDLLYSFLAWIITGLVAGGYSLLTNLATTLPEVDYDEKGAHENGNGK